MLTCVILASFAAIVGVLTDRQLRGQFNDEVRANSEQLAQNIKLKWIGNSGNLKCNQEVRLKDYASAEHVQIRIFNQAGLLLCTQDEVRIKGVKSLLATPYFPLPAREGTVQEGGYRVVATQLNVEHSPVWLLYARPLSDVDHTIARVQVILLLGVLGGTVLALLGGLATAARAMRPIVQLTEAAREIERTRDPRLHLPVPEADDEVAELARTVEGMLSSLDAARGETHAALERQREFVADASHELRTPLTSLLANLELLAEELDGEQADTAEAALRSARRMRRLVGDLLLLPPARVAGSDRSRRRAARGRLRTRADGRGPRAVDRRSPGGRARRARRPASPDAQSDRERGAPHSPGHAHPRGHRGRRRSGGVDRRGRRAGDTTRARQARIRPLRPWRGHGHARLRPRPRDRARCRRVPRRLGHSRAPRRPHRRGQRRRQRRRKRNAVRDPHTSLPGWHRAACGPRRQHSPARAEVAALNAAIIACRQASK
jgi:HAMP domain-containing protein